MKSRRHIVAVVAAVTLTGCGTYQPLPPDWKPDFINRPSLGPTTGFTHTVTTPSGTFTVRGSKGTGTQIYRNK